MTEKSSDSLEELTPAERSKIRAEVRYALIAAKENREPGPEKTTLDKLLGYLSNGFVLLILGSVITSLLVPHFQKRSEKRLQQVALMKECLSEFLLYSNSLWQEYYATLPLTQKVEIEQAVYLSYVTKITEIKLKRYDAYAKVQALTVVFQIENTSFSAKSLEQSLKAYAIKLNSASAEIDRWLTGMYCTPTVRAASPCDTFDAGFDPYEAHLRIKTLVSEVGNTETDALAAQIVARISDH